MTFCRSPLLVMSTTIIRQAPPLRSLPPSGRRGPQHPYFRRRRLRRSAHWGGCRRHGFGDLQCTQCWCASRRGWPRRGGRRSHGSSRTNLFGVADGGLPYSTVPLRDAGSNIDKLSKQCVTWAAGSASSPLSTPTDTNPAANAVNENVAVGTAVGITAQSTGGVGTITYSLTSNDSGRFSISPTTGIVKPRRRLMPKRSARAISREVSPCRRPMEPPPPANRSRSPSTT